MTKPITSLAWRGQSGKLSAQLLSRRQLFLYGQSGRPAARLVDRAHHSAARGVSPVRARHPFAIEAAVILPDHLHAIWTLPDGDADFATRWRLIKSGFSRASPGGERVSASRSAKGERGIWQRRYWEHTLRGEDDFTRHLNYIHFNPMEARPRRPRAGLAIFLVSPLGA